MLYHVLVVDDRISEYKGVYETFASKTSKKWDVDIRFHYLEKPGELRAMLSKYKYDVILSDVVLDTGLGWQGKNFSLDTLFAVLESSGYGDIPVLLVSSQWDVTNSDLLSRALSKHQWKCFLHWRDVKGSQQGDVDFAMAQLFGALKEQVGINRLPTRVGPDDDIRILHLSDLQFGGFEQNDLNCRSQMAAEAIISYWNGKRPHFMCITGDITEKGLPVEFENATKWLNYISPRLGDPVHLFVPGNHDICLPFAAAPRFGVEKVKTKKLETKYIIKCNPTALPQQTHLQHYALEPYMTFAAGAMDTPLIPNNDHGLPWIEERYKHLGIVFYGFNTTSLLSDTTLPGRHAPESALLSISERISDIQESYENCFIICMCHHSVVPTHDNQSIDNMPIFEMHFRGKRSKTNLVLHGHQHEYRIYQTQVGSGLLLISQASTLNKAAKARPEDSLRGMNLLTLEREGGKVTKVKADTLNLINKRFEVIPSNNGTPYSV
ncbi:MAG: metallophosphoesterase [Pseudomonadota bacterium]